MMTADLLHWIQQWYMAQADGDWEHLYGIRIRTIDNPGWSVRIDVAGTDLEDILFDKVVVNVSDDDWVQCHVHDNIFEGAGGPHNLSTILDIFRQWEQAAPRPQQVPVHIIIDGRQIETTSWDKIETLERGWILVSVLWQGAHVRNTDGTWSIVDSIKVEQA